MTHYVVEQRIGTTWIGISRQFKSREQAEAYVATLPSDKVYRIEALK